MFSLNPGSKHFFKRNVGPLLSPEVEDQLIQTQPSLPRGVSLQQAKRVGQRNRCSTEMTTIRLGLEASPIWVAAREENVILLRNNIQITV